MKAIKLSNHHMKLMLFGLLAVNISWMGPQKMMGSSDLASITVGGSGSSYCPDFQEAMRMAYAQRNRSSVTVTCNTGDGEVDGDSISVNRKIEIRASEVDVQDGAGMIGASEEATSRKVLRFSISTVVDTEATNCTECTRTLGTDIIEDIAMDGQTSVEEVSRNLGERVDAMLNTTQDRMLRNAEDILARAEREAREEALEEIRHELASKCEIRRDTPLNAVEEYQAGQADEAFSLKGEERLSCLRTELGMIRDPQERADYFYSNLMPYLESQLTSSDYATQQEALSFINGFYSSGSGREKLMSIPGGSDAIQMAREGYGFYSRATTLAGYAANNPDNPGVQLQINELKMAMDAKFGLLEQNSPAGSPLNRMTNFWNTQFNSAISPSSMDPLNLAQQTMANGFVYSGNRLARTIPGETTLYDASIIGDVRAYVANMMSGTVNTMNAPLTTNQMIPNMPVINTGTTTGRPQAGAEVKRIPVN